MSPHGLDPRLLHSAAAPAQAVAMARSSPSLAHSTLPGIPTATSVRSTTTASTRRARCKTPLNAGPDFLTRQTSVRPASSATASSAGLMKQRYFRAEHGQHRSGAVPSLSKTAAAEQDYGDNIHDMGSSGRDEDGIGASARSPRTTSLTMTGSVYCGRDLGLRKSTGPVYASVGGSARHLLQQVLKTIPT